jgi:hypothetical protein
MTETKNKRVKLEGGLSKTSSSAEIEANGNLVIEFYDFSDSAQSQFGNDVAILMVISPDDKKLMFSKLLDHQEAIEDDTDTLLLQIIKDKFSSYYEVQAWLNTAAMPYEKRFDPYA